MVFTVSACGSQHCIEDNSDLYECISQIAWRVTWISMDHCRFHLVKFSQLRQLEFGCADRLHQLQQVAQRNGARTWMLCSFWFAVLSLFSVLFRVCLDKRKSS